MCHTLKDDSEYGKEPKGKDGLKSSCKTCLNAKTRKWKGENQDKVKILDLKWKQENPKKVKATKEKYRNGNKGKIAKYELTQTTNLSDNYVKNKLRQSGFSTEQLNENPELIEVKRIIIKIKRT